MCVCWEFISGPNFGRDPFLKVQKYKSQKVISELLDFRIWKGFLKIIFSFAKSFNLGCKLKVTDFQKVLSKLEVDCFNWWLESPNFILDI